MSHQSTFSVQVFYPSSLINKLGLIISFSALPGIILGNIIDLPVKYIYYLSIPYYDAISISLLNIIVISFCLMILSAMIFRIRRTKSAILSLSNDSISLKIRDNELIINPNELKRISLITKSFSFNPFRFEFIYKNKRIIRIGFKSKDDFLIAIELINEIAPHKIYREMFNIESLDD